MSDLYPAIVDYEDASNRVGKQSICTQSAYVALAKAIGGWGDLEEARARFRLESAAIIHAVGDLTSAAGRIDIALASFEPIDARPHVVQEERVEVPLSAIARGPSGFGDDE